MAETIEIRKVRDFGQIIGDSFLFLSKNFKKLFKSLAFIVLPFGLLGTTAAAFFQYKLLGIIQYKNPLGIFDVDSISKAGWSYLLTIVFAIISYTLNIIITYRYITLAEKGEPNDVKDLWIYAKKDFFKIFFSSLGIFFMVIVGIVLCFLPGIYVGVVFTLIFPIMLTENEDFFDAVSRSFKLISNNWWQTFGVLLVMLIIQSIVAYTVMIPILIFGGLSTVFSSNPTDGIMSFQLVSSVVSHLVTTITQPLMITAISLNYFSLVEKKESVGVLRKIDTIGNNLPDATTDPDEAETY